MCIITDTSSKLRVGPEIVFEMAAAFSERGHNGSVACERWLRTGFLPRFVESFCLDILTDRIPNEALPSGYMDNTDNVDNKE